MHIHFYHNKNFLKIFKSPNTNIWMPIEYTVKKKKGTVGEIRAQLKIFNAI